MNRVAEHIFLVTAADQEPCGVCERHIDVGSRFATVDGSIFLCKGCVTVSMATIMAHVHAAHATSELAGGQG